MEPDISTNFGTSVESLLKFHKEETIIIDGHGVDYGSLEYSNHFFEMLGCIFWKGHYFTLERALWDKKWESILFGEFYESSHSTYYSKSIGLDKKNLKNSLIEFVREYLKEVE